MNCWHCNAKLIWGGDHDIDEDEGMEYDIVTSKYESTITIELFDVCTK